MILKVCENTVLELDNVECDDLGLLSKIASAIAFRLDVGVFRMLPLWAMTGLVWIPLFKDVL